MQAALHPWGFYLGGHRHLLPIWQGTGTLHAPAAVTGAVSIGPLTIGRVKVKTQQALLRAMLETEKPIYLDFAQAFRIARELV